LWQYAPAFIVHDWIFMAHKCDNPPDNDMVFSSAALLFAESMKTMMETGYIDFDGEQHRAEKDSNALYLIYLAICSFLAEDAWENPSTVSCYAV
jgi:hypothetical protein